MKKRKFISFLTSLFITSVFTLSACGNIESTSIEQPQTCQHQWVEADCLYPKTCRLCNETEGDALGHDFKDATCTEPKTCARCNLKVGTQLYHTIVIDAAVPATCTKEGLTEGKHCSVCGEILIKQQIVKAFGHSYMQGECIVCGADDPEYIPPIIVDKTFITLHGISDVVYITVSNPSTVVWDVDNEDIVNCEWGVWDGYTIPLLITPISAGDTFITVFNQYSSVQINVTVEEHTLVNGICTQCNTVVDAYYALSYYVLNNGEKGNNDWHYIKAILDDEHSFYIFTNTDMSSLSFVYLSYVSGQEVYTEIYLNNDDNKYKDVYFELTSSSSVDSAIGCIDSTTYSENNQYIYDYQYSGDYPSLSNEFKDVFNSYINLTLEGVALFVLPEQFTMGMFGFYYY